ncbi:hypothetical protein GN244_ATG16149 [Phytophthora infestans]|uniref:Secreted RxLR effector peptide protein n=1 Tax=Phytophthora infestans TaxID=4787 RepID=A0A833S3W6_PHYIN|nr:hypothetical protein GN244_ATG16149 [Phytophthora infestans]
MRGIHFFLLALASYSAIASADQTVETSSLVNQSPYERVNEGHRYLKESTELGGKGEERAITTSQLGQFSALFKTPKFANLPLIKQLNTVRLKLGSKAGKAYLAFVKKRNNGNMNNFM